MVRISINKSLLSASIQCSRIDRTKTGEVRAISSVQNFPILDLEDTAVVISLSLVKHVSLIHL